MNNHRISVLNPLIGVGLLLLTVFTLTSPRMRDYYALHHISNATLYGVAIFRVIIAGSLILGRGRRFVLALRYGVLTLVVAFSLLPPGMKPLAPLICLSVVVLVFAATQTRGAPGPQSSSRFAGSAAGASAGPVIGSLVLAAVLGISAVMAFLDPRYNAAFDSAGYRRISAMSCPASICWPLFCCACRPRAAWPWAASVPTRWPASCSTACIVN